MASNSKGIWARQWPPAVRDHQCGGREVARVQSAFLLGLAMFGASLVGCSNTSTSSTGSSTAEPSALEQQGSREPVSPNDPQPSTPPPSPAVPKAADETGQTAADHSAAQAMQLAASRAANNSDATLSFVSMELPDDGPQLRQEAVELVDYLVQRYPKLPDALECNARLHLMIGETALAAESWQAALSLANDYAYALHGLGKVALRQNELERASQLLREAADLLPDLEDVHHDLSSAYLDSGAVAQAIQVLSSFGERHPESAQTWLLLGYAEMAERDFAKARSAFEKALDLSPESPRAQEGLGRALLRLGEKERALTLLNRQRVSRGDAADSLEADALMKQEMASYSQRYIDVAKVLVAGGDAAEAERVYRKAQILDPSNQDAWFGLLGIYQQQKDLNKALAWAEKIQTENSQSPGAHLLYGNMLVAAGRPQDALQAYEQVLALDPQDPAGFVAMLRLMLQNRALWPKTLGVAQRLVDLRGSAADFELLGQAFAVNQKFADAEAALRRAIELEPNNAVYANALEQLQAFIANGNP
ncbi:MAG: tetratricopeptide repeat protein [bacterium]|nr:tetratricopeptide repeat protein [bacterium]